MVDADGSGRKLRILLDGTPLLGARTGIGRYTAALAEELASMPGMDVTALAFTLRGWRTLRGVLPHGVRARGLPVPARALRAAWLRTSAPPVELLAGRAAVLHATNFVLAPTIFARGVLTVHDLDFLDSPEELPAGERDLPELVRRSAGRAAVVCTPTSAVAEVVTERLGVPQERIVVTPLGVDAAWFAARHPTSALRSALGIPKEYLLFVGADGPRKGLSTLLAAHAARPELPPLVIAGPAAADPPGSTDRVIRTGYLPEVDLRRVVAGASALVLPSRNEGFGLPVLEALACGVPVVCSDVPALREVAGGQAVLAPVGDVEALGAALVQALDSPSDTATLTARRDHAADFSWRRCAEATAAAYRRAAG
ncbi:glycosyltransferase family 1 protein [Actinoalloteichus sp. AHMU CJ021]|uniref:Glycosyltransferase involved in cell wall bisynthesis n=1 Tax=Actinoalloteichus caeruleus DSM 43889 TaxID=1120930 RepID=A0ABT1JME4_ACTCY|nr:glycosyltransferase family 1 protein [Actinoalloteichus caeruleus]AUS79384.1 glycosyltransferase family 1 protein [Actinoalloteichus sp. AHMU CJ021]MCP2333687.1 Glycosyltransferase involved in cell wall bisynthesis [Actinoalloteichus caeruleus DSM 43889]